MSKPTKTDIQVIREIAKNSGIKGCKMALDSVHVGKQCQRIEPEIARRFLKNLNAGGFDVDTTTKELAPKGLADVFQVRKKAA